MAKEPRTTINLSPELSRQLEQLAESFSKESAAFNVAKLVKRLRNIYVHLGTPNKEIIPSVLIEAGLLSGFADGASLAEIREWAESLRAHVDLDNKAANNPMPISTLILSAIIVPEAKVADGLSIQTITVSWQEIVKHLERNWTTAHEIPAEKWEEIIAGAFKKEGYDEVILTHRSGDDGRDVIAIRKGIGTVKILGSVKAYGPGRLVRHDDVRALVGVLAMEPDSSKGIITTTSDFAPKIYTNPKYTALMPTRLELVNGKQLQEWLVKLAKVH